jgi:hypothetical protein
MPTAENGAGRAEKVPIAKPSVTGAEGNDCDNPTGILLRFRQQADLYGKIGESKYAEDPEVWQRSQL